MKLTGVKQLCLAAALSISCSFAVTPTIGVASATGTFTVNSAKVEGNANVFDGSRIQTGVASSRVYLLSGAALTLGTNSAGTLYGDHLLLEHGAAKLDDMNGYAVQAGSYRIRGAQPVSQAVVRLYGNSVQIAALGGSVNVFNKQGALMSHITAGNASEFADGDTAVTGTGQSGATAGQSGATAQTGAEMERRRRRREEALYLTLGTVLAGLGLAVDAILQPGVSPQSP